MVETAGRLNLWRPDGLGELASSWENASLNLDVKFLGNSKALVGGERFAFATRHNAA